MNRFARAFQITVWTGILVNLALAVTAVFAPDWFLGAWGFDPAYPNLWPRFAAWLLILLSLFYIPGANDIHRYRANAVLQVVARLAGVVFFTSMVLLVGFSTRFFLFALLDLAFAVPSGIFLALAIRQHRDEQANQPPATRERDVKHAPAQDVAHTH